MDDETDGSDAFDDLRVLMGGAGLSVAEAIDYYATEVRGLDPQEWADERGTSHQSVYRNANNGASKLPPDFEL